MTTKLVHAETGREVNPGSLLHPVNGGACWRYVGVAAHPEGERTGAVHVSRPTPVGRAYRTFAPHVFGCTLVVDVRLYADRERLARSVRSMVNATVGMLAGGVVAWIVAAVASHYMGV